MASEMATKALANLSMELIFKLSDFVLSNNLKIWCADDYGEREFGSVFYGLSPHRIVVVLSALKQIF